MKHPLFNAVGHWILSTFDYQICGVVMVLLVIVLVLYRFITHKKITRAHCFKLVEGTVAIYLGLTICSVFVLTEPPALDVLGLEKLAYVGVVATIVAFGFGIPLILAAFTNDSGSEHE
jgi:O-antigen/teichoic acid export membrane protein